MKDTVIIGMLAFLFADADISFNPDDCRTTAAELLKSKHWDMTGQTVVLTGGDSGIGMGIAEGIVGANAKVIFLAHDVAKTHEVIHRLSASTGNNALSVIPCDQFSLDSVAKAMDTVLGQEDRIDVFIGDAGADIIPSFITKDGYENVFELEYLSHFYMVQRLLPKIREARGRIVLTAMMTADPGHKMCTYWMQVPRGCDTMDRMKARVNVTEPPVTDDSGNTVFGLYLKILLVRHLAMTEESVRAYSFNPGMVEAVPGNPQYEGRQSVAGIMVTFIFGLFGFLFGLVLGCVQCYRTKRKYHCCLWPLLGLVVGALVGYLIGFFTYFGQLLWFGQFAKTQPWDIFGCYGPNGKQSSSCPMSYAEGGVSAAYLAAAPLAELPPNGAQVMECQYKDFMYADPYPYLLKEMGEKGTRDYIQAVYDWSVQMISTRSQEKFSSARTITSLMESTNVKGKNAFASTMIILPLMSVLMASIFFAKRTLAPTRVGACRISGTPLLASERA